MSAVDHMATLPWNWIDRIIRQYRRAFPKPWPEEAPTLITSLSHDQLRKRARSLNWEKTPYYVQYKGEILNFRKPNGLDAEGKAREVHFRTRDHPKGVEIECHDEYSRYEEKKLHVTQGLQRLDPQSTQKLLQIEDSNVIDYTT